MENILRLENRRTGEIICMRRVRDADGQPVLALASSLPAGVGGPPLHLHFHQREDGTVKAGSLGTLVGKRKTILSVGETVYFPAGIVHRWWNAGGEPLELAGHAIPAGDLDRFIQGLFAVLNASPTGRPSIFYMAHLLWRHRRTQVVMVPPPMIQRIVFPFILLVGHVLGKYRGDSWPGSPASCTGAPEVPEITEASAAPPLSSASRG